MDNGSGAGPPSSNRRLRPFGPPKLEQGQPEQCHQQILHKNPREREKNGRIFGQNEREPIVTLPVLLTDVYVCAWACVCVCMSAILTPILGSSCPAALLVSCCAESLRC